jgi:hypothetical protein
MPSASIATNEPFYSLGPPLAAILALTLGLVVGSERSRARQLLLVVGWSGVGYALYGIVNSLLAPTLRADPIAETLELEPGMTVWLDRADGLSLLCTDAAGAAQCLQ